MFDLDGGIVEMRGGFTVGGSGWASVVIILEGKGLWRGYQREGGGMGGRGWMRW